MSWFGVPTTARPLPSFTSQAQPEPNWLTPVSLTFALKSSNPAERRVDRLGQRAAGGAAAVGPIDSQNSVWL